MMAAAAAATVDARSVKLFNRVNGEKARQLFLTHQTLKKDKDWLCKTLDPARREGGGSQRNERAVVSRDPGVDLIRPPG